MRSSVMYSYTAVSKDTVLLAPRPSPQRLHSLAITDSIRVVAVASRACMSARESLVMDVTKWCRARLLWRSGSACFDHEGLPSLRVHASSRREAESRASGLLANEKAQGR